ncbi:hypothetical protein ACJQWK_03173 [Exserohilum turcicum]
MARAGSYPTEKGYGVPLAWGGFRQAQEQVLGVPRPSACGQTDGYRTVDSTWHGGGGGGASRCGPPADSTDCESAAGDVDGTWTRRGVDMDWSGHAPVGDGLPWAPATALLDEDGLQTKVDDLPLATGAGRFALRASRQETS